MLNQVRCLDQARLRDYVCTLSEGEMGAIEKGLRVAFDLS